LILVDDHLIAHRPSPRSWWARSWWARTGWVHGGSDHLSWWWRLFAALAGIRGGAITRHFAGVEPGARSALERTIAAWRRSPRRGPGPPTGHAEDPNDGHCPEHHLPAGFL